jgi:hypothetical protein
MSKMIRALPITMIIAACIVYAFISDSKKPGTPQTAITSPDGHAVGSQNAKPVLIFEPASLDFGELLVGESRTQSVQIKNTSGMSVTVKEVVTTCGCLRADLPVPVLQAGKSETMQISFSGTWGKVQNPSVEITSDVPGARLVLPVSGTVKKELSVEPESLNFGALQKGEKKTLVTELRRIDGKPLVLNTVEVSNPAFCARWKPADNSAFEIEITATAGEAPGRLAGTAIFVTDIPNVRPQTYLILETKADVVFEPNIVVLPQDNERKVSPAVVLVKRQTVGTLAIESVSESDRLPVEFSVEQVNPSACRLTARITGPYTKANNFGEFLVKTNTEPYPARLPYVVRLYGFKQK